MDLSAARAIIDAELPGLMRALGIPHWRIKVVYEPVEGDPGCRGMARCDRLERYETATLTFDPAAFDDADQLRGTLRHELFHVVLAPFDLYDGAVTAAVRGRRDVGAVLQTAWDHAVEKCVVNLERMFWGVLENLRYVEERGPAIPLKKGYSKASIAHNVKAEKAAGKPTKVAQAIALSTAAKAAKAAGKPHKAPKRKKK